MPMFERQRRTTALTRHPAQRPGRGAGRHGAVARERRRRDQRGESLAFVVLWPALIMLILLLLVHAFIVSSARAEASVAASEGLRAAWRSTTGVDPDRDSGGALTEAAQGAVAETAASTQGWRWWNPGIAAVWSTYCNEGRAPTEEVESGWVRVQIEGEVSGPLSALWPGRLDTVYAVAEGPAVLSATDTGAEGTQPWTPPEACDSAEDPSECLHLCVS